MRRDDVSSDAGNRIHPCLRESYILSSLSLNKHGEDFSIHATAEKKRCARRNRFEFRQLLHTPADDTHRVSESGKLSTRNERKRVFTITTPSNKH